MKTSFPIGSIWRRRDGKDAVVISEPDERGQVRAIVASTRPGHLPYLVYTNTARAGRVSSTSNDSPMDLIHRVDSMAAADLADAADAVVAAWPTGSLAEAVNALEAAAKDYREAA